MIKSMTGFGRALLGSRYGTVSVEIRALNHKFFEMSAKLPNGLMQFEDRLKSTVHRKIRRGKVYLNIEVNNQRESFARVVINTNVARHYNRQLMELKKSLGLKGEITIDQLIALPGVIASEPVRIYSHRLIPFIKRALNMALNELVRDRKREGEALYNDMMKRVGTIQDVIVHIEQRSAINIVRYKRHLTRMIKELTGTRDIDKGRLEQEVALFAKNCDISEEVARLKSHLTSFKDALMQDAEVGKKLDFIAQELYREANTIASKSSDFKISKGVIQIKSEIEKIREQVKNVE